MDNLKITYVPIGSLKPSAYNPRKWSESQTEALTESIERFGICDPIICNSAPGRKNVVLGGHFRLKVAKELGYEQMPVVYVNITDPAKEKELNLRLNKVVGDWDFELLKEFFEPELLLDSGFDQVEVSNIFNEVLDTEEDNFDAKEEVKKIKKPKTKVGDLYQLGPHKLICGDSTNLEVVKRLVGSTKINMVYCDPIYNISLSYEKGIGGTKNYGGSVKDNKSDEEYEAFLTKTLENALAVSSENVHVFYYCDESYVPLVAGIYARLGIDFKRICIWLKGIANPTPQIAFSKVYEPIVYGIKGKPYLSPNHRNFDEVLNKEIGTGNAMIEQFMELINVWAVRRLDAKSYQHPTQKPVTLHDKPIKRCTKVGDNILSLFGGSGGELIAADQLKRNCFMAELDPVFVDLIIRRYEKHSGKKARKIE